jgi:hypothetical protein
MTSLEALIACLAASLLLGLVLVAGVSPPLKALLLRVCPGTEAVGFWTRFTQVMLVLSPLFTSLTFGLPESSTLPLLSAGDVLQRIVSSSIAGAFLAMLGMGLWVSSQLPRQPTAWDPASGAGRTVGPGAEPTRFER